MPNNVGEFIGEFEADKGRVGICRCQDDKNAGERHTLNHRSEITDGKGWHIWGF